MMFMKWRARSSLSGALALASRLYSAFGVGARHDYDRESLPDHVRVRLVEATTAVRFPNSMMTAIA
jgi:hypothetical protein